MPGVILSETKDPISSIRSSHVILSEAKNPISNFPEAMILKGVINQ